MTKPKRGGRPSKYRAEYDEQAFNLTLLGATDADLARAFSTSEVTINAWKREHPSFLKSITDGKDAADAKVTRSLYERAMGYSHKAVKFMTVSDGKDGSHIEEVEYTEHYPPDPASMIFWLKNRQKAKWRDKQDHSHEGPDGQPLQLAPVINLTLATEKGE